MSLRYWATDAVSCRIVTILAEILSGSAILRNEVVAIVLKCKK